MSGRCPGTARYTFVSRVTFVALHPFLRFAGIINGGIVMLKADKLTKRFGDRLVLDALDLSIGAGEIHCLLGANGAGKTTTIHLFLGFLEPTSGAAYVNGREVAKNTDAVRADLAYVPEQVCLYPMLTGVENLAYFTRLAGRDVGNVAHLRNLLDQVGLDRNAADIRVWQYSKGMRQKVGLAIALAKGARALLLDEPLSGLDPQAANEFCALLRRLAHGGTAALMATHDLFRAKEVGDRIGIMKTGRMVEHLAAADLTHAQLERIYLDHMHGRGAVAGNGA
jgi:ABC-2 type transport system ATP-binding protein